MRWVGLPRPAPLPPLAQGALLVPIQFPGLSAKPLYMQFDMGHPRTVFYANKWKDLSARLRSLGQAFQEDAKGVKGIAFALGTLKVPAREVDLRSQGQGGIQWDGDALEIIGTVGSDLIAGRTLVMDFKTDTILVAGDRALVTLPGDTFLPFRYTMKRILIPVELDGVKTKLLYDSGSSAFAWITHPSGWKAMRKPGATPVTFPVRSWGKPLTAHVVATDAMVTIGSLRLPVGEVSHIEGTSWMQNLGMRLMGVGGMAGNRLFLGRRIILDTARQEMAISE